MSEAEELITSTRHAAAVCGVTRFAVRAWIDRGLPPEMEFNDTDLERFAEADRRAVDPTVPVDVATWSHAGQLDWWVKDSQRWWGRVRGANGRQRWIRAVDLRPVNGE